MLAEKSQLILDDFVIIKSVCEFNTSNEVDGGFDFKRMQKEYPINIDFEIREKSNNPDAIAIFIDISINEEKKPGYYLLVEGVGMFSFNDNSELTDKQKAELIQYSAVSMCITNIRLFMANLTSYLPFGKFNFSSIDMNDLIEKKIGAKPETD